MTDYPDEWLELAAEAIQTSPLMGRYPVPRAEPARQRELVVAVLDAVVPLIRQDERDRIIHDLIHEVEELEYPPGEGFRDNGDSQLHNPGLLQRNAWDDCQDAIVALLRRHREWAKDREGDEAMTGRPSSIPDRMRAAADWLDIYDRLMSEIEKISKLDAKGNEVEWRPPPSSDEVQRDLRADADAVESMLAAREGDGR